MLVVAIALPTLFSSCATIFGHSTYPISINTIPYGATLSIIDKGGTEIYKGVSPATVTLNSSSGYFSKAAYTVKITTTGYAEQTIPINFKIDGWYFGNLLLGGLIGMLIVDPATGAMWKLDTPPINVTLSKITASITTPTLKIIDIATLSTPLKHKLVRIK